jgi:hypothetical protein
MVDQTLTGSADRQGFAQRLKSQFLVQSLTHRPADHPPREQIEDHG